MSMSQQQPEKDKQPKKLILFNILDILRKYSDENHKLSQKEIEDLLSKEYGMKVDRKTIKTSLMNLEEFGFELEYTEVSRPQKNRKTGKVEENFITSDYYLRRDFEDSELRLLIDSILFSRHIPYNQCKELVQKLEGLSNRYFKARVRHIATMPQDRTDSQQLFFTIDVLDEAISHNRKVSFKYVEYGTDFKPHAKKNDEGEERIYIVNPYQMAAKEGKYYLICNYDKYENISNYRLDRIYDIKLLDEPAKPFESLKGANGRRLDLAQYMNEHIYMYSSSSVRVKLRIIRPLITDMIDLFGKDVKFLSEDEETVTLSIKANEVSVEQFAKNFAPHVIVLEPENVRNRVIEMLREGLDGYSDKES